MSTDSPSAVIRSPFDVQEKGGIKNHGVEKPREGILEGESVDYVVKETARLTENQPKPLQINGFRVENGFKEEESSNSVSTNPNNNSTATRESLNAPPDQSLKNAFTPQEQIEVCELEAFIESTIQPEDRHVEEVSAPPVLETKSRRTVYLFTGQGAQWPKMAGRYLDQAGTNVFKTSIDDSASILRSLGSTWDLLTELRKEEEDSNIDIATIAIPATVAVQIALVELHSQTTSKADIVLGHSTGEIAAAYAAGILGHIDALRVAYNLAESLRENGLLNNHGKMLAVGLGETEVLKYLENIGGLDIACANSRRSTTIAGNEIAIERLSVRLNEVGIFNKLLDVDVAYHSKQMTEITSDFGSRIAGIQSREKRQVEFYSSVYSGPSTKLDSDYWVSNITSKVEYGASLEALLWTNQHSELLIVEIGPQPHLRRPTLDTLACEAFKDIKYTYFPTLSRGATLQSVNGSNGDGSVQKANKTTPNGNINGVENRLNRANKSVAQISTQLKRSIETPPILKADKDILQIYEDLSKELASLVGVQNSLMLVRTIADCGLDSQLAMQLSTWIGRNFGASISIQEILDSSSLINLAVSIHWQQSAPGKKILPVLLKNPASHGVGDTKSYYNPDTRQTPPGAPKSQLPKLPLPDLEETLEQYHLSVEAFGNETELAHTKKLIDEFKRPEIGGKLQDRLLDRVHDPNLDCWLADLYNGSNFLDRNGPLVPFSSFFYTHKLTPRRHTQAERAAIITHAALEYKEQLEAGLIQPAELNGQPTCMFLFQYLFNTSRKPVVGSDVMQRFPGNDYIVVLRRNRAFKLPLYNNKGKISHARLRHDFEWILNTGSDRAPNVGILTSDDRNAWAKNRRVFESLDPENTSFLHSIEAAAFIINLDEASPEGAPERARHFHFGDGHNRWNDKSVQFVICENGISGFIGDHSMLDAGTVLGFNNFVTKAIFDHKPDETIESEEGINATVEEIPFHSTPEVDVEIVRVTKDFQRNISINTHAFTTYTVCGAALPRSYKCPPKSYFQLVVILASRNHFGYNSALWETVSLGNFHKGRVEINQVIRPCVVEFCKAADDPNVPLTRKRELLFESVKTHTSSVMRAVRGRGIDRHITSLRQMVRDGEEVPAFFADPVYARSRPRKIMSHCHETGMQEKGFLLRDSDAIWVHYEVEEDSVLFSVTGVGDAPRKFCALIEKAAESLRQILVFEQ